MEEIIKILGGSVALFAAVVWLTQRLIEGRLKKDMEDHKSKLKAASDAEIESLKSRLQIAAMEREVTVNWLHEKRASAIESIYASLIDLNQAVRIVLDLHSPRQPEDIRRYSAEAVKKFRSTYDSYLKARVFLSPASCERIDQVLQGIQGPIVRYELFLRNYDDHELHSLVDVKNGAWREIQAVVPPALLELESDMRKLLGVESG